MKRIAMATAFTMAVGMSAPLHAQTLSAFGSNVELAPFEKMEASVSVATDKNGRKFNVVKLPNGKMMVLISMDRIKDFSPYSDDSEMMFGGTKGSTR